MSSIHQERPSTGSQIARRSSFDPNDFPMPVLKTKKSKFAEDGDADSVRSSRKPSAKRQSKLVVNEQLSDQAYWGRVKPYCFDSKTNTPRITITHHFLRSLLLNLLVIAVLCVAVPVCTNHNMFPQVLTPSGRNLQDNSGLEPPQSERVLMTVSARYVARKYSIYIFSAIWTLYEGTFLMILLLGNPGYGDPLTQKQLSLQEQQQILSLPEGKKGAGYSRCTTCRAIVDNSVFHCPQCDLCCQGFTHHCEWIGKCVGYRSQIFLNAYYYGFFAGTCLLVLLILLQSIPQ